MLTRRLRATIAWATLAFAVTACAGTNALTPAPQGLSGSSARTGKPMSGSSTYTFYTVDYPYEEPNRVTGIADNKEIVGVYGPVGSQGAYHSYTSQYSTSQPYSQFQDSDYPNSQSTYLNSIVDTPSSTGVPSEAGYVIEPGDLQGTWGVINSTGLWSLVRRHRNEGDCHMMELFGINSSQDAVGFYWYDKSPRHDPCNTYVQYATKVVPGGKFHDYSRIQGDFPVASGINRSGWMVGSTDDSGTGPSQGWSSAKGVSFKYWTYEMNPNRSTQMLGVSASGTVVGTYEDGSGNWHGFLVTNLFSASTSKWYTIDEPNGNGTSTVISGIDTSGDICGWYTGTDNVVHGFVATSQ